MATFYCIYCNRPISHQGACLPCNKKYKERRDAQAARAGK